jgi:hypothetical protein
MRFTMTARWPDLTTAKPLLPFYKAAPVDDIERAVPIDGPSIPYSRSSNNDN